MVLGLLFTDDKSLVTYQSRRQGKIMVLSLLSWLLHYMLKVMLP